MSGWSKLALFGLLGFAQVTDAAVPWVSDVDADYRSLSNANIVTGDRIIFTNAIIHGSVTSGQFVGGGAGITGVLKPSDTNQYVKGSVTNGLAAIGMLPTNQFWDVDTTNAPVVSISPVLTNLGNGDSVLLQSVTIYCSFSNEYGVYWAEPEIAPVPLPGEGDPVATNWSVTWNDVPSAYRYYIDMACSEGNFYTNIAATNSYTINKWAGDAIASFPSSAARTNEIVSTHLLSAPATNDLVTWVTTNGFVPWPATNAYVPWAGTNAFLHSPATNNLLVSGGSGYLASFAANAIDITNFGQGGGMPPIYLFNPAIDSTNGAGASTSADLGIVFVTHSTNATGTPSVTNKWIIGQDIGAIGDTIFGIYRTMTNNVALTPSLGQSIQFLPNGKVEAFYATYSDGNSVLNAGAMDARYAGIGITNGFLTSVETNIGVGVTNIYFYTNGLLGGKAPL